MEKRAEYSNLLEEYKDLIDKAPDGTERLNRELAESLVQSGLLGEETNKVLSDIMEWEDAVQAANEQIKGVVSELLGQIGSDLKNNLVEAFRAGEDAAKAMTDTLEKGLENFISAMLFEAVFAQQFKSLENEVLASLNEDGTGDGTVTDDFGRFFSQATELTDQFNEAMADAQKEAKEFGFGLFEPEGGQSSGLKSAIRRELTEQTASELTGLYRATFDITKRGYILNEKHFELEQRNFNAAMQTAANTSLIAKNTADALTHLAKIARNTDTQSSNYNRGI
jgi:hypothetical protein